MSSLERAIVIACEAHAGQTDKGGAPYILHPLRVMLACPVGDAQIVGVLHDVVEDCPAWPLGRLRDEGFSEAVLTGLAAVTKREGEDYDDFVERAGADPLGRLVKLADLRDNMDVSRLGTELSEADYLRGAKYAAAEAQLIAMTT